MTEKISPTSRGPFPFAQIVRERIIALKPQDWEFSRIGTSLKVKFIPVRQAILRILNVSVDAQYWVGRQKNGQPRVSFEFNPRVPDHQTLCDTLASEFQTFLLRQGIPTYCRPSIGATVLRALVKIDNNSDSIPADEIGRAIGLFEFIKHNIQQWQEEHLSSLLEPLAMKDALDDLESYRSSYDDLPQTEREDIRKSRIGQGRFRSELMDYWGTCAISDLGEPLILRASHIKPWRDSDNRERLDLFNGLLLSPNFDALFDAGLISFDVTGQILVSAKLSAADQRRLGVCKELTLRRIEEPHQKYLCSHRHLHGFQE